MPPKGEGGAEAPLVALRVACANKATPGFPANGVTHEEGQIVELVGLGFVQQRHKLCLIHAHRFLKSLLAHERVLRALGTLGFLSLGRGDYNLFLFFLFGFLCLQLLWFFNHWSHWLFHCGLSHPTKPPCIWAQLQYSVSAIVSQYVHMAVY